MHNLTIEDNLGLVWNVIYRFFGDGNKYNFMGLEREDLFQVGCIGLMKAVDRFDGKKGEFPTYAFSCIYGEIRKEVRDNGRMVKFPRTAHEIVAKICKQDRKYTISIDEIVSDFGVTNRYAQTVMTCLHYTAVSANQKVSDSEEDSFTAMIDLMEDEGVNIEDEVLHSIDLDGRLSILNDKEREVVDLSLQGLTQNEIADIVGVSQTHVGRLLKKSVEKIQKRFDNALLV